MVDGIQELVNALQIGTVEPSKTYSAEISSIDNEGRVWVYLEGSSKETPTAMSSAEVSVGDNVNVEWRNNKLYIAGNISNPSAGIVTVRPSVNYVNDLLDQDITANSITAATGYIDDLYSKNITTDNIQASTGYIKDLTAENITSREIISDHAAIANLDANYAHVSNGIIDNAKIGYADVNDLNAHYAAIDLANVNNAWIENGVIKDAAIGDAQIIGVSANKLTAGTIDASKIDVTNLNADNLTVGTINGQRIGTGSIDLEKLSEEVPTKEYLDTVQKNLQGQIDGQIETWTGTVVPTLNNSPASDWKTATDRKKHVGDIYYVVNAGNSADGYTYRFTEDSSGAYSWTLIKDNQITKALQDIIDIQGDVSGIKQFDTQISSWKTDTDEELSSIKSRTTTLETNMGTKVSNATFNELKQTVDENSASITTLSDTVDTKADGSTVSTLSNTVNTVKQTADANKTSISNLTKTVSDNETDIEQKYSSLQQDVNGFKQTVSSTYTTTQTFNNYKSSNDAAVQAAQDDASAAKSDANSAKEAAANAETKITQNAEAIALRATKTEVTNAINAIEVGGRNLLREEPKQYTENAYNFISIPLVEALEAGVTYTLQLWELELDENSSGIGAFWGGGIIRLAPSSLINWAKPDANGYLKFTFTPTKANVSHAHAANLWINLYNGVSGHSDMNASIGRWKLERGNKATDWTPAPEDVDERIYDVYTASREQITTLQSEIDVTTEGIKADVTAVEDGLNTANAAIEMKIDRVAGTNDLVSNIKAIADQITLLADQIKIGSKSVADNLGDLNAAVSIDTSTAAVTIGDVNGVHIKLSAQSGLEFYEGANRPAYIDSNKMYITESEVTNNLRIGQFLWGTQGSDRIFLRYSPK